MNVLASLAEKCLMQYLQSFLALWGIDAAGGIDVSTAQVAAIAALPAAITVIANAASSAVIPVGQPFWTDVFLRALKTYAAAFLGFAAAVPVFRLDWSIAIAANAAALPTALAVIKAAIASQVGDPGTAALLPASLDDTSPDNGEYGSTAPHHGANRELIDDTDVR